MRKLILNLLVLMGLVFSAQAQDRLITGTIANADRIAIKDVTVQVKGTTIGTTTDAKGTYSLSVPRTAKSLIFSSIGYMEQEVSIGGKGIIDVTMDKSDKKLEEVVVVGYGTQRKTELTGNLTNVKGAALANRPVPSFEAALGGRAAGVQITVPNGVVNNPPVFRIRGANSISLSTYPLIVVDGVPTYTGDQGQTSAPANALASINPNDIESIDIAKDAAAAAIYGSRAANGVVFITTKKGKSGKAKVGYNGYVGFTQPYGLPDILDANQYVAYKNVALANLRANDGTTTGSFIIPTGADGSPVNTDWYDEVYRQGFSQGHNVNVSGGNDGTTYYMSGGYTKQEGILRGNDFERLNFLLNVDSRVNKIISIGGKLSYSNEKNLIAGSSGSLPGEGFASAGAARLAFALPPNVSPFNNNGTYNIASGTAIGSQGSLVNNANPYTFNNVTMLLALNRSNNEVNHLQSNVYLQVKPVSWLTLKSSYGIDNMLIDNDIFFNPYHGDGTTTGTGPGGASSGLFSKDKTWLWTNTAQIDYTFASKHNVNLLVGGEQQRRTFTGFGINRRTLSDSAYTDVQAGFTTNNPGGLGLGENYLLSAFGRLNYNFNRRYFVSGNVRRDEYSALGVKANTFYGFSAGWEIAQEKFWAAAGIDKVFSSFKLRGSYGKVGNLAGIGNYATYSTYSSGLYGGNATLNFNAIGNPNIQWETSVKTDIGASMGVWQDRLTLDLAWYKNDINNLLLNVPQSPSAGVPGGTIFQNVGEMYNKGVELTLNANIINKETFGWNSSFNFSSNENKVTALAPGLNEILTATSTLETINKTVVGKSAGYLWVVRTAGVDPATGKRIFLNAAGEKIYFQFGSKLPTGQFNWSYADGTQYKKNGQAAAITQADDAVLYKNAQPKIYGGWDNTFRYKGFDLNVLLTYQFGSWIYYGSNAGLRDQRFWNNSVDVLRYWKAAGDVTDIPKPIFGDNTSNGGIPIDVNVFKGDFVKLKTVQVGYTFEKSTISKLNINNIRMYVSAQNAAIFSKYPGPDPEVSTNGNSATSPGVDRNTLANGRTITFGLNVNF